MDKFMIKGILNDNELDKLNSMEGIIELLCDIPNFNMDMYDELDDNKRMLVDHTLGINLLTDSQIDSNLRRSMDNNNIALINKKRLTALSLLYFGVKDENNKYIGYTCPYTGKYYDLSNMYHELRKPYKERNKNKVLELEHIRPHSSGGGTVLFNCIPSSKEANSITEKSDLHLIDWFTQSGKQYYDSKRLYNLVSYILSAYSISFKEYQESDLDYYESDFTNDLETDNDELENPKLNKENIKNKKHIPIEGYIPFLKQLINKLEKDGHDVSLFNNKLTELENNNIISNINKYEIVQDVIENLFKEYSTDDNTSYLTYSLNIDYIKLVNSINSNKRLDIENILRTRLSNIKYLIDTNNKTMKDYFISLKDNQDIDIIYKDNLTNEEIQSFIENIRLSHDTKINIFIKMLENAKTIEEVANIVSQRTTEKFKTYKKDEFGNIVVDKEYGTIGAFWSVNPKIKEIIEEDDKYILARQNLDNYYMMTRSGQQSIEGKQRRQEIFIKMLENAKTPEEVANIVKAGTTEKFKTYKKDDNGNIVVDKEYGEIKTFWSGNPKIREIIEADDKYLLARQNLDNYYMMTLGGQQSIEGKQRRQEIFIKMLENAKTPEEVANIINQRTTERFKTYKKDANDEIVVDKEYGEIGHFWNANPKIREIIEVDDKYILARQNLDNYYMMTRSGQCSVEGKQRRQEIFIKMLENAKIPEEVTNIVKGGTTETFKTYKKDDNGSIVVDKEYGEIGAFWSHNPKIKEMIETDDKYILARQNLDNYYMMTRSGQQSAEGQQRRQEIFIKMLENAKTPEEVANIVKAGTTEKFKTYKKDETGKIVVDKEYEEIKNFWSGNPKIREIIEADDKHLLARQKLDNYYMMTRSGQQSAEGQQRRQEIFIKMLENAKTPEEVANIVKGGTTEKFKTYKKDENGSIVVDKEYGEIGQFWSNNPKIKEMIETDDKYILARQNLDNYYMMTLGGQCSAEGKQRRQEIFIKMLENAKTPEEVANLVNQRTTETFKTYKKDDNGSIVVDKEYGKIGPFWSSNPKIKETIESDDKYILARQNLDNYYMMTYSGNKSVEGQQRRQEIFIKMLENAKTPEEVAEIVKNGSIERFKTYKKDINGNIVVDKEYGEIGNFWSSNLKIREIIEEDDKYILARQKLDNYYMMTYSGKKSAEGQQRCQEIFIKMLENARTPKEVANLVNKRTTEKFKIYKKDENGEMVVDKEYGEIGQFWSSNSQKYIIPLLFYNKYYDSKEKKYIDFIKDYSGVEYDNARSNILKYLKVDNINDYINKLNEKEKKTKQAQNLIDLRDSLKDKDIRLIKYEQELIKDNIELKESINNTTRRAM